MRKPERVFTRARSHHMTIQAQPWSPSSYPTTTRLRGNARHPFVAEALAGPAAVSRRERSSAPTTAGARMQQHGIAEARYCSTPGAAVSWSARWWLLSWRTSSQTPVRSNSAAPDVDLAPVDSRIIWAMQSSRRPRHDGCGRGKPITCSAAAPPQKRSRRSDRGPPLPRTPSRAKQSCARPGRDDRSCLRARPLPSGKQ
jgi:hypothetical protein